MKEVAAHPFGSLLTRLAPAVLLVAAGCSGQGVKVTGKVVSESGEPLSAVRVLYRMSDDNSIKPNGITDEQGHYTLRLGTKDVVPAGTYDVVLTPVQTLGDSVPNARRVPLSYSSFEKSNLRFEVSSAASVHDIEIKPSGS